MERMKISKYFLLVFIISVLLFFIPFFWLKPGEMDLGGDNSRLYFYDPVAYLKSQSLYSVSHSGFGAENLSFYPIPFFLLLAFVKSLVHSPTILISIFHGFNLSGGFVSCYLVVKELLKQDEEKTGANRFIVEASSILAGLYYSLSPNPTGWWSYPLLSMNLVFLNPLLFFLMLRFFLTSSMKYIYASLLITFLFSPNFSFIGAPTFFSFFPLAGIFLIIYTKVIRKKPIPIVKIIIGLVLFVLIQGFHLIPQTVSILTPGSFGNEFIFGDQGKLQWGLKYFQATAPAIKVSISILGHLQYTEPKFYWSIFILFPLFFVLGLLWNKSRLYLLSVIFFVITLFFVSANITHTGLKLYMMAFRLPGFSMFRVFFGQWAWAYIFFYTVLVGLSLATVLRKIKTILRLLLMGFLILLLVTTAWPFISGKSTDTTLWQSKDIKSHVKMDPIYQEVLSYIRSLPVDGKILSLPLNDHGYQVLKGENDAAYVGPSTITYLAARNEFTSNAELGAFGPSLLAAARAENYAMFRDILSALNIKYIFYNEDPYIYLDNFPGLPYTEVRNFFPDTQEGYKEFIKKIGVREVKSFGGKFHIYEFNDALYAPHIYVSRNFAYWSDIFAVNAHTPMSFYADDKRIALVDNSTIYNNQKELFDTVFFKANNKSNIFDFFKKKKNDKFVSPTISQKFSSLIYPLVVLREKRDLSQYAKVDDVYIDRSIYFAEKRINELYELKNVPLLRGVTSITELAKQWKEPELWEFIRHREYNSWEITLARYQKAIERLVSAIDTANQSAYSGITSKVELKNYLKEHKTKLRTAVRQDSSLSVEDRWYLSSLIERMFVDINNSLNLDLPDVSTIPYSVESPLLRGTYEVYVKKEGINNLNIGLHVDGKKISTVDSDLDEWMKFETVTVEDKQSLPLTLSIDRVPNLVEQSNWTTAEQITSGKEVPLEKDPVTLAIKYNFLGDTSGLVRNIHGWESEAIYTISFDYLTYDKYFTVVLHERGGTKTRKYVNDAYEETLRSKTWRKFSVAVLSSKDADSASLQITKALDDIADQDKDTLKTIEIKNLLIQKIYDPKIILKSVAALNALSVSQITFTQINPIKYLVNVRDAKNPYALVFSQAFNQNWKLYNMDRGHEAKTMKGIFMRFAGSLLGTLTQIIIPASVGENATIASFADPSITEGKHRSEFWGRSTFDTWGLDPIAEKTHLPVNGYANAWYIKPEDVSNKSDYTLIIEMAPQKLFYGSLIVSIGVLFMVITLFMKSLIRIRK